MPSTIINSYLTLTFITLNIQTGSYYSEHSSCALPHYMNADLQRYTSSNDRALQTFCTENSLQINPLLPNQPTFHHFNKVSKSRIDLVIHPCDQAEVISTIEIDSRNLTNTSCHDALIMRTRASPPSPNRAVTESTKQPKRLPPRRVKWDKMDTMHYNRITGRKLEQLSKYTDADLPTEVIITRINTILSETAEQCSPTPRPPGKPKTFKWNPALKPLVANAKSKHHLWKCAGKPADQQHPTCIDLASSTKEIRSMQRQLAADERRSRHKQIMAACEDDRNLFYQLVRRQRQDGQDSRAQIDFPTDPTNGNSQANNWAIYFRHLATPSTLPHFDEEHRKHTQIKYLLLQLLTPTAPVPCILPVQIDKHIRGLKLNKAPDAYGVQAEHVKHAHSSLVPIITDVINRIYRTQTIPDVLKLGEVTPLVKKQKAKNNPDHYRRITVTPIIGKILEEEMVPSTNKAVQPNCSKNQFGFKDGVSCNNAAVLLTELLMDAKDTKQAIYVSYMDTSKAFDMVHHEGLLCALSKQGVHGPLWNLYNSAYSNIRSEVKWSGEVSEEFEEGQGIRQGAKTSTGAFNAKADPLLHRLSSHTDGYMVGTTNVGAIMVADDLTLASPTPHGLQSLIHVAEHDAQTQRYLFSDTKTKVLISNGAPPSESLLLNGKPIGVSPEEIHLGITRRDDLSAISTVQARIQTARRTVYALAGAGMYGLNGVNISTIMQLITIYVLPRLTYGLECLTLSPKEVEPMEVYYRNLLRQVQHLPQSTANPAVYLLVGALPVEALIHKKVLCIFGAIMRRDDSLEYQVMERQLGMKSSSSHSWAIYVKKLLHQYNLPQPAELLYNMMGKCEWKKRVKQCVWDSWYKWLKEEALNKSTLKYLNLEYCQPGIIHPVWAQDELDPLAHHRATVHVHLLVQRYPINTSHTSKKKSSPCPCCQAEEETLEHFLLKCKQTAHIRSQYLPHIVRSLQNCNIPNTAGNLLQAVLDSSVLSPSHDFIHAVTSVARSLCFHLHKKRCTYSGSTIAKALSTTMLKRRKNVLNYRDPTTVTAPGAPKQRGGTSG